MYLKPAILLRKPNSICILPANESMSVFREEPWSVSSAFYSELFPGLNFTLSTTLDKDRQLG
jgi:hypothetical protein